MSCESVIYHASKRIKLLVEEAWEDFEPEGACNPPLLPGWSLEIIEEARRILWAAGQRAKRADGDLPEDVKELIDLSGRRG